MTELQNAKALIRQFHAALDGAGSDPDALSALVARFCTTEPVRWYVVHPFGKLLGADAMARRVWSPLKHALSGLHRREDIFFAGRNEIDGERSIWVVSMGHLVGLFDFPWLTIEPTGKMSFLPYCAFYRVGANGIAEAAFHMDIPHLMAEAGCSPFGSQTAAQLVHPGPRTHDGLLFEPQPDALGVATLAKINSMIGNLGQWRSNLPLEEELAIDWHDDMVWWGPTGIGSAYTIERYAKQHSAPFRAAFSNRSKTGHIARLAEGHYGGFFGWPNFTAELSGAFMGRPATGKLAEFRVIDLYRRDGDKLAENWVFIDLLHFWKCQGVDHLE